MITYVVRYCLRDSSGNLLAATHRRVHAKSLAAAKKIAREHLPNGHDLSSVSEAGPLDKQPWIGQNPYADRQSQYVVRGEG